MELYLSIAAVLLVIGFIGWVAKTDAPEFDKSVDTNEFNRKHFGSKQ